MSTLQFSQYGIGITSFGHKERTLGLKQVRVSFFILFAIVIVSQEVGTILSQKVRTLQGENSFQRLAVKIENMFRAVFHYGRYLSPAFEANNRVMEPGILNAGLWLTDTQKQSLLDEKNMLAKDGKHYNELGANDYLKRRKCPILVIYPIDLSDDLTTSEDRTLTEAEKENIKHEKAAIKESLGSEEPLLAFAIGFPQKESGVTVIYRANQVKLDEMNANLEIDDEDEGTEDDDD